MAREHCDVLGTITGRNWHRARGESLCGPCRDAWNAYCRDAQKAARTRGWQRSDRPAPKVKRRPGTCSKCGCAMQATSVDEPVCSSCRGLRPGRHIAVTPSQREAIYDRDEWTCQICLDPVDPHEDRRRRWGATLDHIIPVSQGGGDAPENLRLAHRWCNSVRGDLRYYTDADLRVA